MSKKPSTIRIGRRYRANRLDGPYDALVVGSGIGGLTAAACLAKMGKKICVLEQHYTAGGFTHSYDRNGYEWDVGVHYIGDVGHPETLGRRLFDYVTEAQLQWAPMDENFDRIFLGAQSYDLVAGKTAYRKALIDAFPAETGAIDTYFEYLAEVSREMRWHTLAKIMPAGLARLMRWRQRRRAPGYFFRTTRDVLETLTSNQDLIAVLTGQWGDCGLPPARSSFIIHSLIARHYLHGGYYPVGGSSRMAETILPVIRAAGGEVFTYACVDEIRVENGRVSGVRMADGHDIDAPIVISNAGVQNTFGALLADRLPERAHYLERMSRVRPSMASMCLYIGLKDTAERLGLPRTNYWIYPSAHYEADIAAFEHDPKADLPLIYISFPSAKDPSFESRYPGRATIEIVAPGPHEWFAPWENTTWGKRGEDYEALKERLSQRLLEALYEHFPHLRGQVDYTELSTSLSTAHFCRYGKGEIYGLDHDPQRFEQSWLRPKTTIRGLYLTGQDVVTCGVSGAMLGGLLTAVQLGGLKGLGLARRMLGGG